jgi:uncharacterized membrane protein HdeD (DUF308 family)
MLADTLSRNWWMTLLQGLISILFGIALFTRPVISLVTLTLLFGAFVFADGILHIASAFGGRRTNDRWWVSLLAGLCGIAVGVLTFFNPGTTALALLFFIAIWAIVIGFFEVITAIRLRKEIVGEFWLILMGIVSIAFGVMLLARPGAGALSVIWLIAAYAVAAGIIRIFLAFEARSFAKRTVNALRG